MIIITNNELIKSLNTKYSNLTIIYAGENVTDVIERTSEMILYRDLNFISNPLCGRIARPVPYLSVLLSKRDIDISVSAWDILMSCQINDSKNKPLYQLLPFEIKMDFAILDYSLVSCALKSVNKSRWHIGNKYNEKYWHYL